VRSTQGFKVLKILILLLKGRSPLDEQLVAKDAYIIFILYYTITGVKITLALG
jgi:hypothetical protein